jgi:hypothetical protein
MSPFLTICFWALITSFIAAVIFDGLLQREMRLKAKDDRK